MTATDDGAIQRIARKMASSGQFPDFESIERAMGRVVGEAVQRIGSRSFRRQMDRVCAMAQCQREQSATTFADGESGQKRPVEAPPHASTRT